MFFAVAMVCLFSTVIPMEQFSSDVHAIGAEEVHVTIRLEGEIARRYLADIRSSALSASFEKNGKIILTGVAYAIDESRVAVRHTSIVRVVGRPLALLSMETVVDRAMITIEPDVPVTEQQAQGRQSIRLTDIQPVEIRVRSITGSFPDSPRYN